MVSISQSAKSNNLKSMVKGQNDHSDAISSEIHNECVICMSPQDVLKGKLGCVSYVLLISFSFTFSAFLPFSFSVSVYFSFSISISIPLSISFTFLALLFIMTLYIPLLIFSLLGTCTVLNARIPKRASISTVT